MNPRNIFASIPPNPNQEIFEWLLQHESVAIERIVSKGHQSPQSGWYDQEKNEWVMVLKGKAALTFEDQSVVTLNEGDYLLIPAHHKHRVSWTDPDRETIWLAVWY